MSIPTHLEFLGEECARELLRLLKDVQDDCDSAIALDSEGRVLGIVGADDLHAELLLGDLDLHA